MTEKLVETALTDAHKLLTRAIDGWINGSMFASATLQYVEEVERELADAKRRLRIHISD